MQLSFLNGGVFWFKLWYTTAKKAGFTNYLSGEKIFNFNKNYYHHLNFDTELFVNNISIFIGLIHLENPPPFGMVISWCDSIHHEIFGFLDLFFSFVCQISSLTLETKAQPNITKSTCSSLRLSLSDEQVDRNNIVWIIIAIL